MAVLAARCRHECLPQFFGEPKESNGTVFLSVREGLEKGVRKDAEVVWCQQKDDHCTVDAGGVFFEKCSAFRAAAFTVGPKGVPALPKKSNKLPPVPNGIGGASTDFRAGLASRFICFAGLASCFFFSLFLWKGEVILSLLHLLFALLLLLG